MTGFLQCEKQKNFLACDHSARKIVKKRRISLQFENFVMLIVNTKHRILVVWASLTAPRDNLGMKKNLAKTGKGSN